MNKELFDFVTERTDILSTTQSSKQETKDAALAWKEAAATKDDAAIQAATDKLIDFLEGRPVSIDAAIAFAEGPAKEMFGEEAAANLLATQQERKAQGAKYCGCEACTAASELLAKFGRISL